MKFFKIFSKPYSEFIFNFVTPNGHVSVPPLRDLPITLPAAFTKLSRAGLEDMI